MESVGAFPDGEWDCFRRMFAGEEHDYSSLLQNGELNNIGAQFCSAPETGENELMFYSLHADHHNSNYSQHISQENSYSSNCSGDTTVFNNYFSYPDHVLANNYSTCAASMDFCMDEKKIASFVPSLLADIAMDENVGSERLEDSGDYNQIQLQLKRKLDLLEPEVPANDKTNNRAVNQKKKPRLSKDGQGCMKNSRYKKNLQKLGSNGEEAQETNTGSNGQTSSSNISEDDNASQENSAGATSESKSALNSSGKTRASRGSATDPQSLYARKRREKINERLRILQNLVPNGTKVDISTMLEEAVNYVKFLQLQIKLLSSDDLWMYAPLAYNGLDIIGLNLNLNSSPPL